MDIVGFIEMHSMLRIVNMEIGFRKIDGMVEKNVDEKIKM